MIELDRPKLRVFFNTCTSLAVFFVAANFATPHLGTLIFNVLAAILFWYYAIKSEELLEKL